MSTPPDPPEDPTMDERTADWCGRDECPHCQGYEYGPQDAPDCPWLGESLPDNPPDTVSVHSIKHRGVDCPCCDDGQVSYQNSDGETAACHLCGAAFPVTVDGAKMIVHIPESVEYDQADN